MKPLSSGNRKLYLSKLRNKVRKVHISDQKFIVNPLSSENSTLRLLNDEIKKIHKQHIEAVNIQHQSEMELLADLVTFMRIKGSS